MYSCDRESFRATGMPAITPFNDKIGPALKNGGSGRTAAPPRGKSEAGHPRVRTIRLRRASDDLLESAGKIERILEAEFACDFEYAQRIVRKQAFAFTHSQLLEVAQRWNTDDLLERVGQVAR